uniref:R3H domain-containing protein n=1 Tax=Haraldiophyllum bonnemaisonii TaxID=167977 RepID=A0A4D6WTR2_9FLOR|nr:hypothetical protein [Haraldiophyllum bonnemaisonii]
MLIADDLDKLLKVLPDFVKNPLDHHPNRKYLIEVVMDLGRRPEARFPDGPEYLSLSIISWHDLDFCVKKIGNFSGDNRAGIECTLHRISSIKNRKGNIVGLTFRVGRAIFGTISIIRDLLHKGQSILLLGRPGVGKTTAIREISRVLADEMQKRVVIIDTSNEIAGDGDIPHPAIGRARRMQVTRPEFQHQVMIEAVENHMPEVIIIDEIGTELEALAARTIAERGVQLVGTVHGNYLENLIKNPMLSELVGGIEYVTLGDDEAKRRGSQKSILERKAIPAFQIAIEIHERYSWIIHEKVDQVVDQILQGSKLFVQRRKINDDGSITIECEYINSNNFISYKKKSQNDFSMKIKNKKDINKIKLLNPINNDIIKKIYKSHNQLFHQISLDAYNNTFCINSDKINLYVYGFRVEKIESILNSLRLPIILTMNFIDADIIIALRSDVKNNSKIRQIAKNKKITIYTIHSTTNDNIIRALKQILNKVKFSNLSWHEFSKNKNISQVNALLEIKFAIKKIVSVKQESVKLLHQCSSIRKLQYDLINLYNFKSSIVGEENKRRLIIYPK